MFFHTHVYYSKIVSKKLDSLTMIGSILPDFALTSTITWDDLHKKHQIQQFSSFLSDNHPEFLALSAGIHLHNTLDYITHIKYKDVTGYAYANRTPELIQLVSTAFSISEERAKVTAHNFIESAIEIRLVKQYSELPLLIRDSVKNTDVHKIAEILSTYYKKPEKQVNDNLEAFFSLPTQNDLTSIDEWTLLWEKLGKFLFNTEANKELVKEAIALSISLTENNYKDFIQYASSIKEMEIIDCN